jgi:membrane protease YdiL (CAAX protease family)
MDIIEYALMEEILIDQQKPDEAPWTIRQTALGIIATLVPWFILILGLDSLSSSTPTRTTALAPQVDLLNAIVTFIFSCLIEGAFLVAPLTIADHIFRPLAHHLRMALHALGFRKFKVERALVLVVLFMLAIFAINILYQDLITALHLNLQTNDQVILQQSKYAPLTTYATLFAAAFVAPICEETFFRGFVFMGLSRVMPLGWAIVLSSFLFALAHGDPGSFAVLFIIGLALAFLRWRTQSLWPGIFLHFLNNGLGALLIVLTMLKIVH